MDFPTSLSTKQIVTGQVNLVPINKHSDPTPKFTEDMNADLREVSQYNYNRYEPVYVGMNGKVHPARVTSNKRWIYRDDTNREDIKDYVVFKRGGNLCYDKGQPLGVNLDKGSDKESDEKKKSKSDCRRLKNLDKSINSHRVRFVDGTGDVDVTKDSLYTVLGYQVESRYHDEDDLKNPNMEKNDGVVKVTFNCGADSVFTIFCNLLNGKSSEDAYEAAKQENGTVRVIAATGQLSIPLDFNSEGIEETIIYHVDKFKEEEEDEDEDEEEVTEDRVYFFSQSENKWIHDKKKRSAATTAEVNLPSKEEQVRGTRANILHKHSASFSLFFHITQPRRP